MTAEEFRKKISDHYVAAMKDCQIPTGALAELNRAEFYAFSVEMENERLRAEVKRLSEFEWMYQGLCK
jgi:hypothetical protein